MMPAMVMPGKVRAKRDTPMAASRRALRRSVLPSVAIVTLPSRSVRKTRSAASSRRAIVCRLGWP